MDTIPGLVAGEQHTVAYERLGEGPPVLFVGLRFPALATHFRMILPHTGGLEGPDGDRRLAHVMEGLGLEGPPVVAHGRFADPVLRMALRDPWRLGALALVFEATPGRPTGVPVRTNLDPIGLPALFLPLGDSTTDPRRLVRLTAFLEEVCRGPRPGR